jgi:hypothetical protein
VRRRINLCFPKLFYGILHTSLALMLIYCRCIFIVALQIHCTKQIVFLLCIPFYRILFNDAFSIEAM